MLISHRIIITIQFCILYPFCTLVNTFPLNSYATASWKWYVSCVLLNCHTVICSWPILAINNEETFLQDFLVKTSESLENLKMFSQYYMHSDVFSRFKSSTTHSVTGDKLLCGWELANINNIFIQSPNTQYSSIYLYI